VLVLSDSGGEIAYVLTLLIPAGGLVHCIAGTSEVLIGVFAGEVSSLEYLRGFLLPATLGNIVGGVFLVALLNYAQVAGSSKKTCLVGYTEEDDQVQRVAMKLDAGASFGHESVLARPQGEDRRRCWARDV
jgi:hypothetical protein